MTESKKLPTGCNGILADDLFDGDQCECEFRSHIARSRGIGAGAPHETRIKKTTRLGDLFDGECPYADPSRTFLGDKSHFNIAYWNDNSAI